jgi:hypothetical protein
MFTALPPARIRDAPCGRRHDRRCLSGGSIAYTRAGHGPALVLPRYERQSDAGRLFAGSRRRRMARPRSDGVAIDLFRGPTR